MKLVFDDIVEKEKNKPCVIALHGPSIDPHIEKIESLQNQNKVIRLSVNEWYDHFSVNPDYWVISNSEFTIEGSLNGNGLWASRNYPKDVFNKYNIPVFYNRTADHTPQTLIDEHLKCDYLPYDSRHFKGHSCLQILKNFRQHYMTTKSLNYLEYGNNSQMWQRPDVSGMPPMMHHLYGKLGSGWDIHGKCCSDIISPTIQERLQVLSGHEKHMGPGQTVGMFAIILAVLMGCNPIFVGGLDLDCTLGYGKKSNPRTGFNHGHIGHWKKIFRDFLIDDMVILKESAEMMGTKIINLNKDSWHNVFLKDKLEIIS